MFQLIVFTFFVGYFDKEERESADERGVEELWVYFYCRLSVGDERAVCEADAGMRFVVRIYGFCADCAEFSNSDCDYFG